MYDTMSRGEMTSFETAQKLLKQPRVICHPLAPGQSRQSHGVNENRGLLPQYGFQSFVEVEGLKVDGVAGRDHDDAFADEVGGEGELDLSFAAETGNRLALLDNGQRGIG